MRAKTSTIQTRPVFKTGGTIVMEVESLSRILLGFIYRRWENSQRKNSTNTINNLGFPCANYRWLQVWYKFCDNPAKFRQSQSSQADMVQLQLRKGQLFVCNATWLANQEVKLELRESCRQRQESILGLAVSRSYHQLPPWLGTWGGAPVVFSFLRL